MSHMFKMLTENGLCAVIVTIPAVNNLEIGYAINFTHQVSHGLCLALCEHCNPDQQLRQHSSLGRKTLPESSPRFKSLDNLMYVLHGRFLN